MFTCVIFYTMLAVHSWSPLPLFPVLQTGEFSARFLLKLPVDFSNIPVYLLKVINQQTPHTLWLIMKVRGFSGIMCTHCRLEDNAAGLKLDFVMPWTSFWIHWGIETLFTCMCVHMFRICAVRMQGLFKWSAIHVCVFVCEHVCRLGLGGCELTNQQAVTLDLLWAACCLEAA